MMELKNHDNIYERAQRRVEKIRRFYIHVIIYIIINFGVSFFKIYRNMENGETFSEAFLDFSTFIIWLAWGVGLALHAFSVYGIDRILGKNWEENKIEEFMQDELNNTER